MKVKRIGLLLFWDKFNLNESFEMEYYCVLFEEAFVYAQWRHLSLAGLHCRSSFVFYFSSTSSYSFSLQHHRRYNFRTKFVQNQFYITMKSYFSLYFVCWCESMWFKYGSIEYIYEVYLCVCVRFCPAAKAIHHNEGIRQAATGRILYPYNRTICSILKMNRMKLKSVGRQIDRS